MFSLSTAAELGRLLPELCTNARDSGMPRKMFFFIIIFHVDILSADMLRPTFKSYISVSFPAVLHVCLECLSYLSKLRLPFCA